MSELTIGCLLIATMALAIVTLASVARLFHRFPVQGILTRKSCLLSLLHIPVSVFLFIPAVIWNLMDYPFAANLLALFSLLLTLQGFHRSPATCKRGVLILIIASTATWVCFAFYENEMQKWSRTVVAPIRADLLLLAPMLYATLISLYYFWRWESQWET